MFSCGTKIQGAVFPLRSRKCWLKVRMSLRGGAAATRSPGHAAAKRAKLIAAVKVVFLLKPQRPAKNIPEVRQARI
jgi:hypothetical protein